MTLYLSIDSAAESITDSAIDPAVTVLAARDSDTNTEQSGEAHA